MKFTNPSIAAAALALLLGSAPLGAAPQDEGGAPVAPDVDDVDDAVQALIERYQEEYSAWSMKRRSATPEERKSIPPLDVDGFVSEFVALAESAPGSEPAAKAWMYVMRLAPQGSDDAVLGIAVDTLLRDHLESGEAVSLPGYLVRALAPDVARVQLARVAEKAPKGALQAGALLEMARMIANDDATVEGSEAEKELEALVARIQKDYADLTDQRERPYGTLAEGLVFARKYLKVGQVVPEIEAADTQGVNFKLSDYRGKVVLLDFWGNW